MCSCCSARQLDSSRCRCFFFFFNFFLRPDDFLPADFTSRCLLRRAAGVVGGASSSSDDPSPPPPAPAPAPAPAAAVRLRFDEPGLPPPAPFRARLWPLNVAAPGSAPTTEMRPSASWKLQEATPALAAAEAITPAYWHEPGNSELDCGSHGYGALRGSFANPILQTGMVRTQSLRAKLIAHEPCLLGGVVGERIAHVVAGDGCVECIRYKQPDVVATNLRRYGERAPVRAGEPVHSGRWTVQHKPL